MNPFDEELNRRLIALFGSQAAEFVKALEKYLLTAASGGEKAAAAERVLKRIANETSDRMTAGAARWGREAIPNAMQAGLNSLKGTPKAGTMGIDFGGVNMHLLNRLVTESVGDLAGFAEGTGRKLRQGLKEAHALLESGQSANKLITESLARGTLEQETRVQLTDRLMRDLNLEDGDRLTLEGGQSWDAEAYAKLVARTRPMEAANLQCADSLKSAGYDYIETSYHEGVSDDDICSLLQGMVWALNPHNDLGIPVLPADYGFPPWHPNCVHTFGAFIPDLKSAREVNEAVNDHKGFAKELDAFRGNNGELQTSKS